VCIVSCAEIFRVMPHEDVRRAQCEGVLAPKPVRCLRETHVPNADLVGVGVFGSVKEHVYTLLGMDGAVELRLLRRPHFGAEDTFDVGLVCESKFRSTVVGSTSETVQHA
jgi:hypothetical protein